MEINQPQGPIEWGDIGGTITNQTDLILYLSSNYYPLLSNPAGYLTAETDPLSLHLDQTTPQTIINGIPLMNTEVDFAGSGYQLVNKNYVDLAVSSINIDYFLLDASSGVSTYKNASTTENTTGTPSVASTGVTNNQLLMGWITPVGEPIARKLIKGIYDLHIHALQVATLGHKNSSLYFTLVERKTDNSEITIFTSENSNILTTSSQELEFHGSITSDYSLSAGSRLVCKVYATVSGIGTNPDITLYYQGTTSSNFALPTNTEVLNNVYLKLDQTTSQTILNGQPIWDTLTASKVVFTDANKKFTSTGIGTSSQFIKGDGSLDSNTYLTSQYWEETGASLHPVVASDKLSIGSTDGKGTTLSVYNYGETGIHSDFGEAGIADFSGTVGTGSRNTIWLGNLNGNTGETMSSEFIWYGVSKDGYATPTKFWEMGNDANLNGGNDFFLKNTATGMTFISADGDNNTISFVNGVLRADANSSYAYASNLDVTGTTFLRNSITTYGKIVTYNNIGSAGWGISEVVYRNDSGAKGADISNQQITNTNVAGEFKINYYLYCSTADGTSGTITMTLSWIDGAATRTYTVPVTIALTNTANWTQGSIYIRKSTTANATYSVAISGSYNNGRYMVFTTAERLN